MRAVIKTVSRVSLQRQAEIVFYQEMRYPPAEDETKRTRFLSYQIVACVNVCEKTYTKKSCEGGTGFLLPVDE